MKYKVIIPVIIFLAITIPLLILGSKTGKIKIIGFPELLISGDKNFIRPVFSPDGKYLALTTNAYKGIYIYNMENKETLELTEENGAGFGIEWSPDSKFVIYRSNIFENRKRFTNINIIDVKSKVKRSVFKTEKKLVSPPVFSNNGSYINFTVEREIVTVDKNGVSKPGNISISKMGLFDFPSRLLTYTTDGNLHTFKTETEKIITSSWSGDMEKIVYEAAGSKLYTVSKDGTEKLFLTDGERPEWSPNNDWIVYMLPKDDGHKFLSSDIFLIKADGSRKIQITDTPDILEFNPDWSPDGESIVFNTHPDGDIYLQRIKF